MSFGAPIEETPQLKVAVVGSRDFEMPELVGAVLARLLQSRGRMTVLSGGARGVDTMARDWCIEQGFHVCGSDPYSEPYHDNHYVEYLAIWRDRDGRLDRGAGFKRNRRIVAEADMVVALFAPGPRTPGTSNTVDLAIEKGVPLHVWHEGAWHER